MGKGKLTTKFGLLMILAVAVCLISEVFAAPYIDYGALVRDSVPCSMRGSSWKNCKTETPANSYQRGCSKAERCRSSSTDSVDDTPDQQQDQGAAEEAGTGNNTGNGDVNN